MTAGSSPGVCCKRNRCPDLLNVHEIKVARGKDGPAQGCFRISRANKYTKPKAHPGLAESFAEITPFLFQVLVVLVDL